MRFVGFSALFLATLLASPLEAGLPADAIAGRVGPDVANGHPMIGRCPALVKVLGEVEKVAKSSLIVLIEGETGTGKELVARALHARSGRTGEFIAVNMSTLGADLADSTLFGHEKGAFTGAVGQRQGLFELAANGTLFLDEIGELPLPLQAKLLRVLDPDSTYTRMGGNTALKSSARIVCATHRNLREEVKERRFREDLFYRLGVISISLPPLRERMDDLDELVAHLIEETSKSNPVVGKHLSPEAMALLRRHTWPGNIRELRAMLSQAAVLAESEVIGVQDLKFLNLFPDAYPMEDAKGLAEPPTVAVTVPPSAAAPELVTGPVPPPASEPLLSRLSPAQRSMVIELAGALENGDTSALGVAVDRLEKEWVVAALKQCNGRVGRAAGLLGISPNTLQRAMTRLGIPARSDHDDEN